MRFVWIVRLSFLISLCVLLAYGVWLVRRQNGLLGCCVSLTTVLTIFAETVAYVVQNCGIILFLSRGLPLFSYGGLSLCQTMFLLGLPLSTQRMGGLELEMSPKVGEKRVSGLS